MLHGYEVRTVQQNRRQGKQASLRDFPHSDNGPCSALGKNFPASVFPNCCQMMQAGTSPTSLQRWHCIFQGDQGIQYLNANFTTFHKWEIQREVSLEEVICNSSSLEWQSGTLLTKEKTTVIGVYKEENGACLEDFSWITFKVVKVIYSKMKTW